MNKKNVETYKMLMQVVAFIAQMLSVFPKTTAAAEILKTLENGVKKLAEAAATSKSEATSMREASKARATARKNLRDLIDRASLISRALRAETVQVPRNESEHELMSVGRAFVTSAEALKKDFARYALPPDDVLAAVETLEGAINAYATARTARSAAFNEWNKTMAETMDALIGLDALVATVLADNPVALASYEQVRSIVRTRGRAASKEKPPATAPAVTTPVVEPQSPPAPAPAAAATAA